MTNRLTRGRGNSSRSPHSSTFRFPSVPCTQLTNVFLAAPEVHGSLTPNLSSSPNGNSPAPQRPWFNSQSGPGGRGGRVPNGRGRETRPGAPNRAASTRPVFNSTTTEARSGYGTYVVAKTYERFCQAVAANLGASPLIVSLAYVKVSRECRIAAATPVVKEAAEDSVLSKEYIDDERDVNDGPKNRDRPERVEADLPLDVTGTEQKLTSDDESMTTEDVQSLGALTLEEAKATTDHARAPIQLHVQPSAMHTGQEQVISIFQDSALLTTFLGSSR
ncbi:hypothetical protein QR680_014381 [Steinernema hermaphroditum]|uniref:Uncharacterized protein n=1 Tax=Steinernema hermaphroditum TaxID=289476 RepID=A0AA39IBC5_9BILA|nr:hypothetical protein QR680_014381 [Steinernema hermaphroditum]